MTIQFHDSLTHSLLPLPHTDPRVSFYACGITPYSDAHIGHARSFVVFDLMRQVLELQGYEVDMVRNITDIDDKIIDKARTSGRHWKELAHSYAADNRAMMGQLGVHNYEEPAASEHIGPIIDLIDRLMQKGHAYIGEQGDVLFSVASFKGAPLMPHDLEDLGHQQRVAHVGKRDNRDFVLWKKAKIDEPSWHSPWGDGRPGWHIECSAMIEHRFGATVDYHGGGTDLRFPHHQAEIQQSEAAYGRPLAHRWVHHGSVRDEHGRKMSKSLGNYVLLADALNESNTLIDGAGGMIVRYALLNALWTKPLDYNPNQLKIAAQHLKQWSEVAQEGVVNTEQEQWLKHPLLNNLNTPLFFSRMHHLYDLGKKGDVASQAALQQGLRWFGLDQENQHKLKQSQNTIPEHVQALLDERNRLRAERQFAQADLIRDQLLKEGFEVNDGSMKIK